MIIISLPYYSSDSLLSSFSADIIEYRLDYSKTPQSIDFASFDTRNILTWRGLSPLSSQVQKMLDSSALVDLDLHDVDAFAAQPYQHKLIVSSHLKHYDETLIRELLIYPIEPYARKLIFEAVSFAEIVQTQRLIASLGRGRIIFNVCGKWALFQRSLYAYFSSFAVYLHQAESTYPGQPAWQDFSLIHRSGIAASAKLYGIIGGEQVNRSYSLKAYNASFLKDEANSHYLPIPAQDTAEALAVLAWLGKRFQLGGFSITSPFKESLPQALGYSSTIINTLRFSLVAQAGFVFNSILHTYIAMANTDLIALQECLHELAVLPADSIYIYGTGACAIAFIRQLQSQGYTHIYVDGRNSHKVQALRFAYHLKEMAPADVDLFINASPRWDFGNQTSSPLPAFKKLIELPYALDQDSSLQILAQSQQLAHICGSAFFTKQFQAQHSLMLY